MFKRRRDGKLIKDIDPMHIIMPHLMPNRCDSDVYMDLKVDVTELVKYYEKRKKKEEDLTYFHLFMTAFVKVLYNKPYLNRFVINKRLYDRNDISIAYTAKVNFQDKAKETLVVMKFSPDDTIDTIKEKVLKSVKTIRKGNDNGANDVMNTVAKLPKFLRAFVVGIVKWMDRNDLLPKSIIDDNLYYSSMIVSNLGSIHGGSIYHHLSDFGTSSILTTIGEIKKEKVLMPNGKEEIRDICSMGINLDERIADGVYFIKCSKLIQDILSNPKLLEDKVSTKVEENIKLKY